MFNLPIFRQSPVIYIVQKGDRLLKKVREIEIPPVSVIRIKPDQKVAPDVKQ